MSTPLAPRFGRRPTSAIALVLAVGLAAPPALAQSDEDRAGARAAANAGADAIQQHRWADAADLFTRAESLVHALPHMFYLAKAESQLGQLVKAHENFEKVTREHLSADAPPIFREEQSQAQAEITRIEAILPYVTVNLAGAGTAQIVVTQDGKRIPDALIGVPRPVDPGSHRLDATGGGLQASQTIVVKEGAHDTVTLQLAAATPAVAPVPAAAPEPTQVAAATPTPVSAAPATPAESDTGGGTNGMRIGSYAAFGVGVVGLGLGTVFLLGAGSKTSQANDKFNGNGCGTTPIPASCSTSVQQSVHSLDQDSASDKKLATVGFIIGGVGVATGVVLFILSSKHAEKTASGPSVHPWVGLGSAGLNGTF